MTKVDFSEALRELKNGRSIQREGWNGKGMLIRMVEFTPTKEEIQIDNKGLVIRTPAGTYNNWMPSIIDLLAEDWVVLYFY